MGEIGNPPTLYPVNVPRPWVSSFYEQEFRRDIVLGVEFAYDVTKDRWVPTGPNDQPGDLYVDPLAGDDDAPGDAANPLLTIAEAIARLPRELAHTITVHILDDGTGVPYTYAEQIALANIKVITVGAQLIIRGESIIPTLTSGPQVVAANPLNSGDYRSITVPGAGWTPDELADGRMRVYFTAGPHAGDYAYILRNTADTLICGSQPFTFDGPYGSNDTFEIQQVSTRIQSPGPFLPDSLGLHDLTFLSGIRDPATFDASVVQFEDIEILGDVDLDFAITFEGETFVRFRRCSISGYISTISQGDGDVTFRECGLYTQNRLFSSTPDAPTYFSFFFTGLSGSVNLNLMGSKFSQIDHCVWLPSYDPGDGSVNDYAIITFDGKSCFLSDSWIDGEGAAVPVRLRYSTYGDFRIGGNVVIERSPSSGINTNVRANNVSGGGGSGCIRVSPGSGSPPDIRDNAEYGIDVSGPCRLIMFGEAVSTVPNGIAGYRCRWGAHFEYAGDPGNEPNGLIGPDGVIDFDDRSPAPLILDWTSPDTVGLETLCKLRSEPYVP